MSDLSKKTSTALKWSSVTEVLSKLLSPILNMILARILAPEAFGVLATVTMIISFAEIFVETGFQKYLIQHNFKDKDEEDCYMSIAFWTNIAFSGLLLLLIILLRNPLAVAVGNPDKGHVIAVSSLMIPLYSMVGIQDCRLKKNLEFKKLFYVRIASSVTPFISTIPLALIGLGYWALIIGNIAGVFVRVITLTIFGGFKPRLGFSFSKLKIMLRYSIWTILDGVVLWATNWVDTLLISHFMSDYYLGLYRNSVSMVTMLFSMVTSAVTPVLFSSLSKLQDDQSQFNEVFLKFQKYLCIFLLPIGVGLMLYRDLATLLLFGEQWAEAKDIVGIISLTTTLRTIFISFYGDAYRAKGYFKVPLILQCVELIILIPACIISAKVGFWSLVYTRAFLKLDIIIFEALFLWRICKITPKMTLKYIAPSCAATVVMGGFAILLQHIANHIVWQFISIILCAIIYFLFLFLFPQERNLFKEIIKRKKK